MSTLERSLVSELSIGIILGSTRPGRKGEQIAQWALAEASKREGVSYEIVDLAYYNLPHLDEAIPASQGKYQNDHTKEWAEKIDSLDGFIFVTPEYNHSTSGVLKNALDFIYAEWNNKSAGFISYGAGATGGARAAEHLRLIVGELQIADVRSQVSVSLGLDFEGYTTFKPEAQAAKAPGLSTMLDQVELWARALHGVRAATVAAAA